MNRLLSDKINETLKEYLLNKLLESKSSCQYLIVDTNNISASNDFILDTLSSVIPKDDILIKTLDSNICVEGYYPFMDILKDLIPYDQHFKTLMEKSDIYYFQQPLFSDFFSNSKTLPDRFIELDSRDIYNEKEELLSSLLKFYNAASLNKQSVILINNAENIEAEAFELLCKLISQNEKLKTFFIFTTNQGFKTSLSDNDNNFIMLMNDNNYNEIIDFEFEIAEESTEYEKQEINIQEFINTGLKCCNLFEFKKAKQLLTLAYEEIKSASLINLNSHSNFVVNSCHKISLLKNLGNAHYALNEYDLALGYYNEMLNFVSIEKNRKEIAVAFLCIAKSYIFKQYLDNSSKMIEQSLKIAKELNDEPLIAIDTYFLHSVYAKLHGKGFIFSPEIKKDCEDLGLKHELYNMLMNFYGVISISCQNITLEEGLAYCDKGLKLAAKYKNIHKLGSLYHAKGSLYSSLKNEKKSFHYYKKSELLKKQIGYIPEILSIYNGTGYGFFYAGKYSKAIKYYAKIFPLIRNTKDYGEICATLYNTSFVFFMAYDYEKSIKYFELLIEMMRSLNIKSIPFNTNKKIQSIIAILYFKLNMKSKALYHLFELEKKNDLSYEEAFVYNDYIKVLSHKEDKEYTAGIVILKSLIEKLSSGSYYFYFLPLLYSECADLFFLNGDCNNAKTILEKGIKESERIKYFDHANLLSNKLKVMNEQNILNTNYKIKLPDIPMDMQYILDYAKKDLTFNLLHKKITEINFMNNFQKLLLEENLTIENTVTEMFELMKNYFFIDNVCFLSKDMTFVSDHSTIKNEKGLVDFAYKHLSDKILQLNTEEMDSFIMNSNYAILIPLVNTKNIIGYLLFLSKNKEFSLSKDDINIADVISKQITIAIVNRELKKNLNIRNKEIEQKNQELMDSIEKLKSAQDQLIQAEKMASLGQLVAGVAHEINTPVGISITAASYIHGSVEKFRKIYKANEMKKSDLDRFLNSMEESSHIIDKNLATAGELVQSFKQIAVDQSVEEKRSFNVKKYFEEMILSISPQFKHSKHKLVFNSQDDIIIQSYPGVFYQILNNLIGNSILHAFENDFEGIMTIDIKKIENKLFIEYADNGKGMTEELKSKIFEPFFTTKRNKGGTGLGMSVIYNLVTQKLGGNIKVESAPGKGSKFILENISMN